MIAPAIWIVATWIRRRDAIRWRAIAAGAALAIVVGGSWFVYMAAYRGSAFVRVNNYEFLQRYFDRSFPGPSRGPFFYLTILPGEIAPWPLVVAAAIVFLLRNWKALDRRSQDGVVVAAAWSVGVLLICTFSHYKLPHYALPLYPPLMLLAGAAIDRASRAESWRRVAVVGMVVTASVFIAVGGAVLLAAFRVPDTLRSGAVAIGMASLVGGVAAIVLQGRRAVLAAVTLATATAVAYGAAAMLLLPRLAADMYPYPALGRLVAERVTSAVALGSIGAHTALVYYADRPVTFLATPSDAARFLSPSEPRLLVLLRREFETVKDGAPKPAAVAASRRTVHDRRNRGAAGGECCRRSDLFPRQLIL